MTRPHGLVPSQGSSWEVSCLREGWREGLRPPPKGGGCGIFLPGWADQRGCGKSDGAPKGRAPSLVAQKAPSSPARLPQPDARSEGSRLALGGEGGDYPGRVGSHSMAGILFYFQPGV